MAADCGTVSRTSFILSVSIAKVDPIHVASGLIVSPPDHTVLQSRIWAPIIDMEPALVNSYLLNFKEQAVYYRDVLSFYYPKLEPTADLAFQLANGIVNAKRLIILPFYHKENTTINQSIHPFVPFEPTSPWSSAPGTVAPEFVLGNFNVLISNMNVFQRNQDYGFEHFISEIQGCNALNGGMDTGLTSGMIDLAQWNGGYRYYVVDLSRRLAGDNTPKSITVIGKNRSTLPVDLYFYVEYERHLSLDVESGHISVSSN